MKISARSEPAATRAIWPVNPDAMTRVLNIFGWGAALVVIVGSVLAGRPGMAGGGILLLVVVLVMLVPWFAALTGRITDQRILGTCYALFGIGGACANFLQPDGPGFIAAFVAMAALGLRLRRRLALGFGALVLAASATTEGLVSEHPLSAILEIALGAGFLFIAAAFAAVSRDAYEQAQARLAEQEETRLARERAAALAERSRLARELHDVLAHTLSGLAVHLESTRLLATHTDADPRIIAAIAEARALAQDGMKSAKQAVSALHADALPGPDMLPALISEHRLATGIPITLTEGGTPSTVGAETGLCVYRAAQEALTNVTKHAGSGAQIAVNLSYSPDAVALTVTDHGGDSRGPKPALPSSGYGLAGLAERASALGGRLMCGPIGDGWRVHLRLPRGRTQADA